MQTFGVALLSRYPIKSPNTIYTFGDSDEIGSIYAQIQVNNKLLNIYVNHPAGSDSSKLDHLTNILKLASGKSNVIILGDFNWNETTQFYPIITQNYNDTWRSIYPTGIDSNGLNMSSNIDHIFVSPTFNILNSVYIPSPASESDHPAYWTSLSI